MSESKRTIAEVQQEYQGLCLRVGHLQYQVFTHNKDIDMLNTQLRDLNLEAAQLKAQEQKEAEKPALSVVPEEQKE